MTRQYSAKDIAALVRQSQPRKPKFGNQRIVIDDIRFMSQKEGARYCELKLLVKAKEIKDLVLQPRFNLTPQFVYNGETIKPMTYVADFQYYDHRLGKTVVEDVKGFKTKEYVCKKKVFLNMIRNRMDVIFKEV